MALSALLVVGGYLISEQQAEPAPVIQEQAVTPATNAAYDANGVPATTAPPIVDLEQAAIEPATAVARAVTPSVVRIGTGFGQGSGIIWDAANGYIVTNDHVTDTADTVSVLLHNGVEVSGVVIGGDTARDISVVQIDPGDLDLVEATFAPSETIEVGQLAVAIGSPFGLDQSVTAGIVSATNRITSGGSDEANRVPVEMIQTDAPINPGNSGGALANRDGHVIGMNTSIRTDGSSDNAGVGFAVPSDTIVLIAERIINGESLELGFLGVSGDTPTDGTLGARVTSVVPGEPADDAGLEVGDLIVSVDGVVVATMEELAADFKFFRPGELVKIEVLRSGERLVFDVTVGSN
jgi:putative serine protease PepD